MREEVKEVRISPSPGSVSGTQQRAPVRVAYHGTLLSPFILLSKELRCGLGQHTPCLPTRQALPPTLALTAPAHLTRPFVVWLFLSPAPICNHSTSQLSD